MQQIVKSKTSITMKENVKKLSATEKRKIANKLAGPITNWLTVYDRKLFANGVVAGLTQYEKLQEEAK